MLGLRSLWASEIPNAIRKGCFYLFCYYLFLIVGNFGGQIAIIARMIELGVLCQLLIFF